MSEPPPNKRRRNRLTSRLRLYGVFAALLVLILSASVPLFAALMQPPGTTATTLTRVLSAGSGAVAALCIGVIGRLVSAPPVPSEPPVARRAVAKRKSRPKLWNERLKLIAGMMNAIGASSFLALVVIPLLGGGEAHFASSAVKGLAVAVAGHLIGQMVLSLWAEEE